MREQTDRIRFSAPGGAPGMAGAPGSGGPGGDGGEGGDGGGLCGGGPPGDTGLRAHQAKQEALARVGKAGSIRNA